VLKDRLYTAAPTGRAALGAERVYHMTQSLVRLMAPVLSFTAAEAWETLTGSADSVVRADLVSVCATGAMRRALRERWQKLRALRSGVLKLLEDLRVAGKIGSSLAGEVDLYAI